MTKNKHETFLDNGSHKVHSEIGRKVFEALNTIRNREERNIYTKNMDFLEGVEYQFDYSNPLSNGLPKKIMPDGDMRSNYEPFGALKSRANVPIVLISKVQLALNGGTEEKLAFQEEMKNKNAEDEFSESEDE